MIYDNNLSWKAKGLLTYLLSRPDDWKVYEIEIVKHSKDKRDSVRSGIKELIENGYIERKKIRGDSGKFEGYEYYVYETSNRVGFSNNGKSNIGESNTTNNKITNNDITKVYTVSSNSEYMFKHYEICHQEYMYKKHPLVSKEELELYMTRYKELSESAGIDEEQWIEAVEYHFDNLPPDNNGHISYFLSGDGYTGVVRRYLNKLGY